VNPDLQSDYESDYDNDNDFMDCNPGLHSRQNFFLTLQGIQEASAVAVSKCNFARRESYEFYK